jgi:hypothetical protein
MDPDPDSDPDPAIFVIDLQDANKKLIFFKKFFCFVLSEGTFNSKIKSSNEVNGSGSRRPKNMWIRNNGKNVVSPIEGIRPFL